MEVSTLNIALYRWLQPFLDYIKTKGFTVSPDTHIQLLRILTGLSDKISDNETLFDYIAPVLAKSGEQYKQLKQEFDNYYSNINAEDFNGGNGTNAGKKRPGIDENDKRRKWKRIAIVAISVMLLAYIAYLLYPGPKVGEKPFQIQNINISEPVTFRAAPAFERPQDTTIAQLRWDFGDGIVDSSGKATVIHQYNKAGVYKTSLAISDPSKKLNIVRPLLNQQIKLCKPQIFLDSDAGLEVNLGDTVTFTPIYNASYPPGDSNTWLLNGNIIKTNVSKLSWPFNKAGLQTISYIDPGYLDSTDCAGNQADKSIYVKPPTNITADVTQSGAPIDPPVKLSNMWWIITGLLLGGSLVGYLWALSKLRAKKHHHEIRPEDILSRFKGNKPPYEIPFKNYEDTIDDEPYISKLARNLKRRMPDESAFINIPLTIRETIRSEGMIVPQYSYSTRPIEYLVLIDRKKTNNQQVKLFEYLLRRFIKTDLFIEIFYYADDPTRFANDQYPKGIGLTRLFDLYSRHVLIVFSEGNEFIRKTYPALDEVSAAAISKWENRNLVTPKPISDWDYKEKLLHELFEVLPADLEGQLLLFAKQEGIEDNYHEYRIKLQQGYTLKPYDFENARDIEKYLADPFLFQWICALAVYPAINWSVLLAIGDALQKGAFPAISINYTSILKMVRIPWMAEGSMPDDTRLELLKLLQPANELIARRTMIQVMNEAVTKITENSFVYEHLEMQRITDKFMLYAQNPDDPDHKAFQKAHAEFKLLWKNDMVPDYPLSEYLKKEDGADWTTLVGNRSLSAEPEESKPIEDYFDEKLLTHTRRWQSLKRITRNAAILTLTLMIGIFSFKNKLDGTSFARTLGLTTIDSNFLVPVSLGYIPDECFSTLKAKRDSTRIILSMGENWALPMNISDTVISGEVPYTYYKNFPARLLIESNDQEYTMDSSFTLNGTAVRVQYIGCPVVCSQWQQLVNPSIPEGLRGTWYNAGLLNAGSDSYTPVIIQAGEIDGESAAQMYQCASDPTIKKLISKDQKGGYKAYVFNQRASAEKIGLYAGTQSFSNAAEAVQFSSQVKELASYINLEKLAWHQADEQAMVNAMNGKWQRNKEERFEVGQTQVFLRGINGVLHHSMTASVSDRNIYSALFVPNTNNKTSADSVLLYMIPIDTNHMLIAENNYRKTTDVYPAGEQPRSFYTVGRVDSVLIAYKQISSLPVEMNDIWIGYSTNRLLNISLTKKLLYYSTGDEQTYGTYPISKTLISSNGTYKVISNVNGTYNVFFFQKAAQTGFNLAVCLQVRNMSAEQVEQMGDNNCDIYHRMRLYYPTNANRIYLPNNSRNLVASEKRKWNLINKEAAPNSYNFQAYVNSDYLNKLDMAGIAQMLGGLQVQNGTIINSFRARNTPFGRSYVELTVKPIVPNIDPKQTKAEVIQINSAPPRNFAPVSEAMFQNRLEDVIAGKSDVTEFEDYLCDGQSTIVYVNGVKTNFASLFKSLASSSRQITAVDFTKINQYNDGRRCIKELSVTHRAAAAKY